LQNIDKNIVKANLLFSWREKEREREGEREGGRERELAAERNGAGNTCRRAA